MIRLPLYILVGILTSFYLFPFSFTFIPQTINTKIMVGFLGIIMMVFNTIRKERLSMTSGILGSIAFSFLFSLICFIATDINNTTDYAYANYVVSLSLWLVGAYGLCSLCRLVHGEVTLRLITCYLAAVCASQCIIALMIDNNVSVKLFVDSFAAQGHEFFEDVDRLYGVGAALDPAGVRFSVVLVLIAGVLNNDVTTRKKDFYILFLLLSFFIITVIGNIISRTTILGVICAAIYFILGSGIFRIRITHDAIKLTTWFVLFIVSATVISVYLYETNEAFYNYIRFAFEGFFNYIEVGEWRTDSTDKLNREMWIWPNDFKTWMIGSGLFDGFVYNTDIGYCRFILYCGLIGFSTFAAFFVFLPLHFAKANPQYTFMFLLMMALTFMIWIKVSTDIFQFYALFFCIDKFSANTVSFQNRSYENRVLHPRYV